MITKNIEQMEGS